MCGRFVAGRDPVSVAAAFGVQELPERMLPPNYNVAPTQQVSVVRDHDGVRCLDIARWGLIPSWAKDPSIGNRMINARSETVAEKPAYRSSFATRRCIVPADGFYEWQRDPKVPYYLQPADGSVLAMAGLFAWWRDPRISEEDDPAAWVMSTTILTMASEEPISAIHDRSPVALPPELFDPWLDPAAPGAPVLAEALAWSPEDYWSIHEVSRAVNRPQNNSPELLNPVVHEGSGITQGTLEL